MKIKRWQPRSKEDDVLRKYSEKFKGLFILEIPVSITEDTNEETKSEFRRIDAIRIPSEETRIGNYKNRETVVNAIKGNKIEVIEVKKELNRSVIGQVIVGRDFFKYRYNHWDIQMVILTRKIRPENRSLLKWCSWNHILVNP